MKIILSFLIAFISFGTFAQTNFLDSSSWTVGLPTNQQGSFVSSGGDVLNEVVNGTDPFGSTTALWQTTSNGPDSYPGLKINNLTVNNNTTYRFSIWVKQLNSTTPNYALKIRSNATDGLIKSDGTFTNDNYLTAWQLPTNSEWFLIVGYIKGNSDGSSYPEAGVYDISTSTQLPLGYSIYNFNTTTTSIEVSAFIYGSSDANDKILFFDPRMEVVNGQEPSVTELLNSSGSTGGGTTTETVWNVNGADINYMNGNVGIGTDIPSSYKLDVNGNIHAKEVKVDLVGWPDYVFEENYTLPTLKEVAKHIEENGHLINIPSAQEVEINGVELGEMNKLLLEKIEELTLYILEQEKRIKSLEANK